MRMVGVTGKVLLVLLLVCASSVLCSDPWDRDHPTGGFTCPGFKINSGLPQCDENQFSYQLNQSAVVIESGGIITGEFDHFIHLCEGNYSLAFLNSAKDPSCSPLNWSLTTQNGIQFFYSNMSFSESTIAWFQLDANGCWKLLESEVDGLQVWLGDSSAPVCDENDTVVDRSNATVSNITGTGSSTASGGGSVSAQNGTTGSSTGTGAFTGLTGTSTGAAGSDGSSSTGSLTGTTSGTATGSAGPSTGSLTGSTSSTGTATGSGPLSGSTGSGGPSTGSLTGTNSSTGTASGSGSSSGVLDLLDHPLEA
eukprot:TRINITY_DN160_c0_g1_i2.p1 TRINITY_DN160_c0_g1~~TRINITY_DN160_c0_g1_i2.p1  ORF type:complete len:309 (-),score=48.35 TRINITY_DN160_c0_g1_i2:960-1886(-)